MDWLDRIPVGMVRAHVEMLDRLQSEEMLDAGSAAAVGAIQVKPKRAPSWIGRQWSAWLRAVRPRHASRPRAASVGDLAAAGIRVRVHAAPSVTRDNRG